MAGLVATHDAPESVLVHKPLSVPPLDWSAKSRVASAVRATSITT